MTTTTLEKPPVTTGNANSNPAPTIARTTTPKSKTILVGFDLGTNKSCVLAGAPAGTDILVSKVVPTVVGYVKDGIVDGIIAGNAKTIYGEDALRNMLHARLVAPVAEGVIVDPDVARDFMQHLRSLVDPSGTAEIRAVVGMPANAGTPARDDIRRAAYGVFDRIP
jgi:rod shape-determining protein MreB